MVRPGFLHVKAYVFLQIVKFEIYHLDLGVQTEDPCDKSNDVLRFYEDTGQNQSLLCAKNYLTEFTSLSNTINVTFTTNAEHDAQGFRIFYYTGSTYKILHG